MNELLQQAELLGERALEIHNTVAEGEVVSAVAAVGLELAALRLTLHAVAGQHVEPRGAELPEIAEGWYVVELMGHRRRHGYVRTVKLASRQLVEVTTQIERVDAAGQPTGDYNDYVERYAAAAIYCLTESTEDDAREEAGGIPF